MMRLEDFLAVLAQCEAPKDARRALKAAADYIGDPSVSRRVGRIVATPRRGRPLGARMTTLQGAAYLHFRKFRDMSLTGRVFGKFMHPDRLEEICKRPNGRVVRSAAKLRQKFF